MFFVKGRTQIHNFKNDPIGDDESFGGEELGPFFQLIDFKLPPESLEFVDFVVLAKPRRRLDVEIEPDVFEFVFFVVGVPHIAEDPRNDRPHFSVLIVHLVAHVESFEEHQSQNHAYISFQLGIVAGFFSAD